MKAIHSAILAAIGGIGFGGAYVQAATIIGPAVFDGGSVGSNSFTGGFSLQTIVDAAGSQSLAPGTYTMTSFKFYAGQNGDVEPILVVSTGGTPGTPSGGNASAGNQSYTIIATGSDTTVDGTTVPLGVTTVSQSVNFTIPSGPNQTVYAGIETLTKYNPVFFDSQGASDSYTHAPSGTTLASPSDNTFNNRSEEISITVSPVPEPASLGLIGLGGFSLLARRRRRA